MKPMRITIKFLVVSIFFLHNTLHAALITAPESPREWYNSGVTAFESGDYDRAAVLFGEAAEKLSKQAAHDLPRDGADTYWNARFNAGNAYAQAKQYEKALEIFKALEKEQSTNEIVRTKREYLEQLLQNPPDSSQNSEEQDDSNDRDKTGEESADDKNDAGADPKDDSEGERDEGEGSEKDQRGDQSPGKKPGDQGDDNGPDVPEKGSKKRDRTKEQGEDPKQETDGKRKDQATEPQKQQSGDTEKDTRENHKNPADQNAKSHNYRQTELNQRIEKYLDAVDAQGQESFKASIQQACSADGGTHDKNW